MYGLLFYRVFIAQDHFYRQNLVYGLLFYRVFMVKSPIYKSECCFFMIPISVP